LNIVYVYSDSPEEWNSSEWRCSIPARAIQRTGLHTAQMLDIISFAQNTSCTQEVCTNADVIVIQRNLYGPVLNAIQRWKAHDKVVIADFDDAYDLMPPTAKNYGFWVQGKRVIDDSDQKKCSAVIDPPPLTQFKWGLRLVDAATMPSTQMVEDWKELSNAYHLPNFIELENYTETAPQKHEGIIIGWGGSPTHLQTFAESGLLSALRNICQARPQVKVMICGDERVFSALNVPGTQKIFKPWVLYKMWPQQLANFDIGLAPLLGPYDHRRSGIKIIEYMAMKIPWVASDGPAYRALRSYGWLVQNKANAWERILFDMVDHLPGHKSEASQDPFLYSLSQSVDQNVERILALYQTIKTRSMIG
jgi:glycosyltransferase involved in cell wall biosynthesis